MVAASMATSNLASVFAQEPRLGGHEAERVLTATQFGVPRLLEVGPDGKLYATFPHEGRIRIIDPDDGSTKSLRLASGAQSVPYRIGWLSNRLWATDWQSTLLIEFDENWRPRDSTMLIVPGRAGDIRGSRLLRLIEPGRALVETTADAMAIAVSSRESNELIDRLPPPLRPGNPVRELPIWLTSTDGTVLDTVLSLSTRHRLTVLFPPGGTGPGGLGLALAIEPFADHPLFHVGPTGQRIVVVDRTIDATVYEPTFAIHLLAASGDTVWTRRYTYDPVPLEEDWIQAAALREGARLSENAGEGATAARAGFFLPQWLAPVTDVRIGPQGWIWLERELIPDATNSRWEILTPNGDRHASILIPSSWAINAVHGRLGWATEESDGSYHLWRIRVAPD